MRLPTRSIGLACMALWGCSPPNGELPPAYRDVQVPVDITAVETIDRGRDQFLSSCAPCHGEYADGHGPRRTSLTSPPADFTNREWRRRMSARRVFWRIREGVPATDMPSWKALDEASCWDLTAYVLSVAEHGP